MAQVKSRSSKGTAAAATASSSPAKPTSFDAELDALFSAAATAPPGPVAGPSKRQAQSKSHKRKVDEAAASSDVDADTEDEDDEDEDEDEDEGNDDVDGEEGEVAADGEESASGAAESDDEDVLDIDSSDSEADPSRLVHETLLKGKTPTATTSKKAKDEEEPRAVRDRRSIFVGNLPVSLVKSRSGLKALKKHLLAQSPYPSLTQIQSIRLRSIPFSKPTDDYDARNPDEADKKMRRRQRSQAYKEALSATAAGDGDGHAEAKKYLSGAQKRKVAFITQQVNEKADSINAYVTLAPITSKMLEARTGDKNGKAVRVTAPVLAALLARCAHGTVFEERHLRADLVIALEPAEVVEAGLDTIKTADGSLIGITSGASGVDREGRKRTAFVGNIDFEVREDEVRDFFNLLLAGEKGEAPLVPKLDFSKCAMLPAPENTLHTSQAGEQERSWVQDVRIIRDSATQMGKGFGYVRFLEAACVDEVLAIHESELAFFAAAKAGKATASGPFRRKLKLKGRALRVSRCKVPKGNVTPAKRDAVNGGLAVQTPKASKLQRTRSTGAPTPGGSSPFAKKQRLDVNGAGSPTRRASNGREQKSSRKIVPNPAPQHSDPLKAAEVAKKKADPDRQARRIAKKNAKRTAQKMKAVAADIGTTGKVSLKPKSGGSGSSSSSRGKPSKVRKVEGKK